MMNGLKLKQEKPQRQRRRSVYYTTKDMSMYTRRRDFVKMSNPVAVATDRKFFEVL